MTLQYQVLNPVVIEIEDKLKELSLAFKKIQTNKQKALILVDGKDEIVGKKAILEHLRLLEGELNSWYYCDC